MNFAYGVLVLFYARYRGIKHNIYGTSLSVVIRIHPSKTAISPKDSAPCSHTVCSVASKRRAALIMKMSKTENRNVHQSSKVAAL